MIREIIAEFIDNKTGCIYEADFEGNPVNELIRCKDCTFYDAEWYGECNGLGDGHMVNADDYCSWGKRREE